jgi:putative sterol carrier protein
MMDSFQRDIDAMNLYMRQCDNLNAAVAAMYEVLKRNGDSLTDTTASFRLEASDTGRIYAFALTQGQFGELSPNASSDVTVTGKEANLLLIFQRKLNPVTAVLLRKVRIDGDRDALTKLAAFL